MKPFTAIGSWWFSDQPEARLNAVLDYSLSRGTTLKPTSLQYMNLLERLNAKNSGLTTPVLIGVAQGRKYTLSYCHFNGFYVGVGLIVEGKHFERQEDIAFPAYTISYSGLDEWGSSGRLQGFSQQHENGKRYFQMSYEMPPSSEGKTRIELKNVQVEIIHSVTFHGTTMGNRAELVESTVFRVVSKRPKMLPAIEFVEYYSNLLRNFLMLATRKHITPLYVYAWSDETDVGAGQLPLYWQAEGMELELPQYSSGWLFTMQHLGGALESVMQAWEENWEAFQPFVRNYFNPRYFAGEFLEQRFLNYIQALEAFHKKKNPKYPTRKGEKQVRLIDRVIHRFSLVQNYSHIAKIIGNNPDKLAQALVDVRNPLVHEADLTIGLTELAEHCQLLEWIILVVIYQTLGFSHALVEEITQDKINF